MKKICLSALILVGGTSFLFAQTPVENKGISKNFSISSSTANADVVDAKFEIAISESGYYLVILEADPTVPYKNPDNCHLGAYWNNGHVFVFNKSTSNEMSPPAGDYKWVMTAVGNGCTAGHTVPHFLSRSYILYLQAGHRLGVKAYSEKVGTLALSPWSYSGKVQLIRLN